MIEPSAPSPDVATPAAPDTDAVCPFLMAADGRWRASTPAREHRCTAVSPAAILASDKQRRLCLVADHQGCATFLAATGHPSVEAGDTEPAMTRPVRPGRREVVRTAPLVLDHGRLVVGVPALGTGDRSLAQGALLALMVVAFAAILVARLSAGAGGDATDVVAGGSPAPAGASGEPAVAADPTASPGRTLVPTEVQPSAAPAEASGAPPAEATPAGEATPAAEAGTYKVRTGDTLSGIAAEHGTTWQVLAELNGIDDPGKLRVGQVLQLP
jgi:LysM repeat protein